MGGRNVADLDLEALERLAKAATPGPWHCHRKDEKRGEFLMDFGGMFDKDGTPTGRPAMSGWISLRDRDAPYIAAANPDTVLALIARVRELGAAIERQAAAAKMGMDAAKAAGAEFYRKGQQALTEAGRLAAHTSFAELESQRAANAILTEENERLEARIRELEQQRAAVPEGAFIPKTAEEMVEFIGSNFNTMQPEEWADALPLKPAGDLNNVRYSLTVHDLLSAFQWAGLLNATTPPARDAWQGCGCRTCRPITMEDMRMVLCPTCGNKRCPHANDHRNACTGSNEPGQPGSAYPAASAKGGKDAD